MHRPAITMGSGRRRNTAAAMALCVAAAWAACSSTDNKPASATTAHAVDSERLEVVMRQMVRMDNSLLPPELDLEAEQKRQRKAIADLAAAIARSADEIPAVLDDVELPPEYRDDFVRLAQDLEDRAERLHQVAPGLSTAQLKVEVQALRDSCTTCHTRFRVLPPCASPDC